MLEGYRRETARFLDQLNAAVAVAAAALVADGQYADHEAFNRDLALYTYLLFATVAGMDGDISPDEMLVMLFQGMGGFTTGDEYFAAVETLQRDLERYSEMLDAPPAFLERALAHDRAHATKLAPLLAEALLGMADAVALADFSEDASERLFLERYRRQMSRYVGEGDEAARPRRLAEG